MADTITRCPKCHTSFRITEAHLKSAKGAVRCGSCLNIFNARNHLVSSLTEKPAKPTAQKPLTNKPKVSKPVKPAVAATDKPTTEAKRSNAKPQAPAPTKPPQKPVIEPELVIDDDEDLLISDNMSGDEVESPYATKDEYEADFNDNILYSKPLTTRETNLFERAPIDEDEDDELKSDESWALDLLNGSDEELPKLRKDTGQYAATTDDIDEIDEHTLDSDTDFFTANIADTGFGSGLNESYEEIDSGALQEELEEEIRKTGYHEPVFTSADPSLSELESIADSGGYEATHKPFIHAIEPEPVEFSYKRDYSFLESRLLWWPLVTVMAVALFIQIAWLQFDNLNRIEPYRSYYTTACGWVGCKLPPLIDRTEIRAVNLVVRSHPQHQNALIVDAVLQNSAAFPQSFPALDLIFTDSQDKPVAARRFEPTEYLGGEMAGKRNMPSQQPIHIALEIVDPGPKAVGYKIAIAN